MLSKSVEGYLVCVNAAVILTKFKKAQELYNKAA